MLYTEDFTMHHYVGFSQIGSQLETSHNSYCRNISFSLASHRYFAKPSRHTIFKY